MNTVIEETTQLKLTPDTPYTPELRSIFLTLLPPDEEIFSKEPSPSFVRSVEAFGVLQPIGVVPSTVSPGGYEIGFGRRRVKSARKVGMLEIPALVFPEGTPLHILAEIENNQRSTDKTQDLRFISQMVRDGADEKEISNITGMAIPTIRKMLRFTSLVPELQEAFMDGRMALTAAERAVRLPKSSQQELVGVLEQAGKLTEKDVHTANKVSSAAALQSVSSLFDAAPEEVPWYMRVKDDITRALGAIHPAHPRRAEWERKLEELVGEIYADGAKYNA